MLSEAVNKWQKDTREYVLILVVMEDALWVMSSLRPTCWSKVLILVVMEDALWEESNESEL